MTANKYLLFLTGHFGSGKGWFYDNKIAPTGKFHKLISATTRAKRENEADGRDYYFRDESYFKQNKFATFLFVNKEFRKPGDRKWLYGVPESEMRANFGKNLVYDVAEPKYIRQMMDWCKCNGFNYNFRVCLFAKDNAADLSVAAKRTTMAGDLLVREAHTCEPADFVRARVHPDFIMLSSAKEQIFDARFFRWLSRVK